MGESDGGELEWSQEATCSDPGGRSLDALTRLECARKGQEAKAIICFKAEVAMSDGRGGAARGHDKIS